MFPFPASVDSATSRHCRLYECLWPMVHRQGSSQGESANVCTKLVDADAIGYIWNLVLFSAANFECNFNIIAISFWPVEFAGQPLLCYESLSWGQYTSHWIHLLGNKSEQVSPVCIAFSITDRTLFARIGHNHRNRDGVIGRLGTKTENCRNVRVK